MIRIAIFKLVAGIAGALFVGALMAILTYEDGGTPASIADFIVLIIAVAVGFWLAFLYASTLVNSWDRRMLFTEQTDSFGERIVSDATAARYRMKPLVGVKRWLMASAEEQGGGNKK